MGLQQKSYHYAVASYGSVVWLEILPLINHTLIYPWNSWRCNSLSRYVMGLASVSQEVLNTQVKKKNEGCFVPFHSHSSKVCNVENITYCQKFIPSVRLGRQATISNFHFFYSLVLLWLSFEFNALARDLINLFAPLHQGEKENINLLSLLMRLKSLTSHNAFKYFFKHSCSVEKQACPFHWRITSSAYFVSGKVMQMPS